MSQFSYKYYRHNYSRNEDFTAKGWDDRGWIFWRSWGVFEYLLSFLLLGILLFLMLLFLRSGVSHSVQTSYTVPALPTETSTESTIPSVKPTTVIEEPIPTLAKPETSDYTYTNKVLPKSLSPLAQSAKDGNTSYGPISIDEYLYFVRETGFPPPDFIDASTNRLIVSKKPKCYKIDCPIVDVKTLNRKFYAVWLGTMLDKDLVLASAGREIMLRERMTDSHTSVE